MSIFFKGMVGLLLFVLIGVLCLFTFIPSPLIISRIQTIKTSSTGINRFFSDPNKIGDWVTKNNLKKLGTMNSLDSILDYNGTHFIIHVKKSVEEKVEIQTPSFHLLSTILVIPITKDSSVLQWKTSLPDSNNPIKRWVQFSRASDLSKIMDNVLVKLKDALESTQIIYGIQIHEFQLKHTYFISHKYSSLQRPEVKTIYIEIGKLKHYCLDHGASITDSPMLHIQPNEIKGYDIMVGLPINKEIKGSDQITLTRMPLHGNMLMSTVKGGNKTIENGFLSLQLYLLDIQRGSPAIPYQGLITDRSEQPDTTQWITRLYYPVI